MHRTADRRWVLLRDGDRREVRVRALPRRSWAYRARIRVVTNADYPALEKLAESAVKDKQKFERLLVSKENLLEMFSVRRRWPLACER